MTGLEALKKLENYVNYEMGIKTFQQSGWHIEGSNEYAIIENSLKALDIYKELFPITLVEIQGQKCISIPADDIRRSDILVPINDEAYDILKEVLG